MKLLMMFLCAILLDAQDPWLQVQAIPAGHRVRVETVTQRQTGHVVSISDDSIRLDSTSVPRSEITRVYAQSASHRKRNTIIGAAIGVGIGIAMYATLGRLLGNEGAEGTELLAIVPAAAGAAIGAAVPTGRMKKVYDANQR
jgi:hypothetical protein